MGDHKFNQFARGSALPAPTSVHDAYGRALYPGDEVIIPGVVAPRWRIQGVTPNVHPGAPAGMVTLTLVSVMRVDARAGQPLEELFRVRSAAEAGLVTGTGADGTAPEKETSRVVTE